MRTPGSGDTVKDEWNPKCPACKTDRWVSGADELNGSLDPRTRVCVDCGCMWIAMSKAERESLVKVMERRKAETR